jgi:crotonobetainyl-CoA:carnitine CoA-transferase CaiB-like acyl-CoA transferase
VAPLTGVRVIEAGDLGEWAGKLLAGAGADVVRVEPLAGGRSRRLGPFADDRPGLETSLRFAYWNTGKRSVTLDPSASDGDRLWRALLASADVLIDGRPPSEQPGQRRAGEVGNERLVWCSLTPFGLDGPWRDLAANDLVSMALGGPVMSSGYDDRDLPPMRPEGEHSLLIAGAYAVASVLAALRQRRWTGKGQAIDVSIHEAVSATTEGAFFNWEYFRRIVHRQTGRHAATSRDAYTPAWQIRCSDGAYVSLMGGGFPRDARTWTGLIAWMDGSGAASEIEDRSFRRRTPEERAQFMAILHRFVASMTAEEAYRGGQALHLPWGIVRRPEENLDDPHWQDREFWAPIEIPGVERSVRIPGHPYRFEPSPLPPPGRAPLLGEHNFEVYVNELGFKPEQLLVLAQQGVI